MIKRIVKMSFHPDKVESFKGVFRENWQRIKGFEGCSHVELLQDENDPSIFFTYSFWESEAHLDRYRTSDLFNAVWGRTKLYFNDRPQAWTVKVVEGGQ